MQIECPACKTEYRIPVQQRTVRCVCGHQWTTSQFVILDDGTIYDLEDDEPVTEDSSSIRPPATTSVVAPVYPKMIDGSLDAPLMVFAGTQPAIVQTSDGITFHERPAPIIEYYRTERSWRFIVRAVDDLVVTLSEFEDLITQHAHGGYDWLTDQFTDVDDIAERSAESVRAFAEQFHHLPANRQAILRPYLTWAIAVTQHCNAVMAPRYEAARQASASERERWEAEQRCRNFAQRQAAWEEERAQEAAEESLQPRRLGTWRVALGAALLFRELRSRRS